MTDKPILFSGPMIRALLDGRKTQTRRILKPQPFGNVEGFQKVFADPPYFEALDSDGKPVPGAFQDGPNFLTPYPKIKYSVGDRLWVREAHYLTDDGENEYAVFADDDDAVAEHLQDMQTVIAGQPDIDWSKHLRLRPSIHMPRWASRLTLIVTDVRVQRLQEITLGDICAEGLARSIYDFRPAQTGFDAWRELWDSIHGHGAWGANPWVAAYTFTVHRSNIDQMERQHD